MCLSILLNSAERHPPLSLPTVVVIVVVVDVRVGSGGDWVTANARLITRAVHADLPLVLPQTVLAGVVPATGDAKNLSILLSLPQGEIWVPALIIFSIPISSWRALRPSEPWISVFHWSESNSRDTDADIILTFTNINTVIVIHVIHIHRDVLSVADLGKLSMCHLILRGPDQVIPMAVLYDSMTIEQVERVLGARIEEQTAAQHAGDMGMSSDRRKVHYCSQTFDLFNIWKLWKS